MKSYRNVPPLAGICSPEDALREGLSVDECVRRLNRYHYAFKRLHQTFTARIPAEPIYELKMAFSLHAHLCAEHATALRTRVAEMREPPLGRSQRKRLMIGRQRQSRHWASRMSPRHIDA